MSDAADAELATAATTGDQDVFDAAVIERQRAFESSSVSKDLGAAGIVCNARWSVGLEPPATRRIG